MPLNFVRGRSAEENVHELLRARKGASFIRRIIYTYLYFNDIQDTHLVILLIKTNPALTSTIYLGLAIFKLLVAITLMFSTAFGT